LDLLPCGPHTDLPRTACLLACCCPQDQPFNQTQFYCVLNTVVALLGSVLSAFAASAALEGKLNMVHIQNATLAGGVAMGAAADLQVAPGGETCILMFAVA
jgi:ammonia channel protein AmtB